MKAKLLIILFSLVAIVGCKKENKRSKIPSLTFLAMTPEVRAGNSEDTVKISLKFEDGDADIRTDGQEDNILISNTRDTQRYDYPMPEIGNEFKDPDVGFKGLALIQLPAAFFLLRDTAMTRDSLKFKITLKDEAGNLSNEIITPTLYLNK